MTARCLVDLVASGHHQRRQGAGGQGAGHGVTLFGDVHLGVVGRSGHVAVQNPAHRARVAGDLVSALAVLHCVCVVGNMANGG